MLDEPGRMARIKLTDLEPEHLQQIAEIMDMLQVPCELLPEHTLSYLADLWMAERQKGEEANGEAMRKIDTVILSASAMKSNGTRLQNRHPDAGVRKSARFSGGAVNKFTQIGDAQQNGQLHRKRAKASKMDAEKEKFDLAYYHAKLVEAVAQKNGISEQGAAEFISSCGLDPATDNSAKMTSDKLRFALRLAENSEPEYLALTIRAYGKLIKDQPRLKLELLENIFPENTPDRFGFSAQDILRVLDRFLKNPNHNKESEEILHAIAKKASNIWEINSAFWHYETLLGMPAFQADAQTYRKLLGRFLAKFGDGPQKQMAFHPLSSLIDEFGRTVQAMSPSYLRAFQRIPEVMDFGCLESILIQDFRENILLPAQTDPQKARESMEIFSYALDTDWKARFSLKETWNEWAIKLFSNVRTMHDLDKERPEASDFLHKNSGITFFGRYTVETLVGQYDNYGKAHPQKLLMLAINPLSDYNTSFYYHADQFEYFGKEFDMRITEVMTVHQAALNLINTSKQYNKPVSILLVGGHGTPTTTSFGPLDEAVLEADKLASGRDYSRYLAKGAALIFDSCFTGIERENALAKAMSAKHPGTTVYAPESISSIDEIRYLGLSSDGRPEFDIQWRFGATGKVWRDGKLESGQTV